MSVSLPSLWIYIQYLGGTKSVYGAAGAIANAVGFAAAPLFGWLSDRAASKQVIILSLLIQAAGGLLYSFASLCDHPPNHDYDLPDEHDDGQPHTPLDPDSSSSGDGGGSVAYVGPYIIVAARFLIGTLIAGGTTNNLLCQSCQWSLAAAVLTTQSYCRSDSMCVMQAWPVAAGPQLAHI